MKKGRQMNGDINERNSGWNQGFWFARLLSIAPSPQPSPRYGVARATECRGWSGVVGRVLRRGFGGWDGRLGPSCWRLWMNERRPWKMVRGRYGRCWSVEVAGGWSWSVKGKGKRDSLKNRMGSVRNDQFEMTYVQKFYDGGRCMGDVACCVLGQMGFPVLTKVRRS